MRVRRLFSILLQIFLAGFDKSSQSDGVKKHYIPKHAHKKAIAAFMRQHECTTYPLREINGMHGGLVRTIDRKKPVNGMRVYFTSTREHLFGDNWTTRTSILRFERCF